MNQSWCNIIAGFLILISVSFFSGCIGMVDSSPQTIYYTFEYEPEPCRAKIPLDVVIQVNRFTVSPLYDTRKIVYKTKDYKRETYHYHKWLINPGHLVSYFLARDLQHSNLYKAVLTPDDMYPSTHIVEGRVQEIFEYDSPDGWEAILTVSITLIDAHQKDISKRVLYQKKYGVNQKCIDKNPASFVDAVNQAMKKLSYLAIMDIYSFLSEKSN